MLIYTCILLIDHRFEAVNLLYFGVIFAEDSVASYIVNIGGHDPIVT